MKKFTGFVLFLKSRHLKHMRVLIRAENKHEALEELKKAAIGFSNKYILRVYDSYSKQSVSHKLKE